MKNLTLKQFLKSQLTNTDKNHNFHFDSRSIYTIIRDTNKTGLLNEHYCYVA